MNYLNSKYQRYQSLDTGHPGSIKQGRREKDFKLPPLIIG